MFSVTVDISSFDIRLRGYMEAYPRIVGKAMKTSATATIVKAARANLVANNSVFRGELHQRMVSRVVIDTGANVTIEVLSLGVQHGKPVELGTKPRTLDMVEFAKLQDWVAKKLGVAPPHIFDVTFAIANTIAKKGNVPHPFLMPAWVANKDRFVKDVIARIRAARAAGKTTI